MNTLTEDQQEIRQLLARYCHAIDGHDDEGWAGLFTEDGSSVHPDRTVRNMREYRK